MDKIIIHTAEGDLLKEAPMSKQAKIVRQLMGDYYIEIPFSTSQTIPFTAGCYIKYNGFEFFLKKDAFPEPIAGVDGYKYVLKFYAPQHHLERCMLKWNVGSNKEVTFTLTTTLDEFAKLLVDNMSKFQNATNAGFRWSYAKSNRIDTREVTFDGISCWDAMLRIAEAFGVECWVNEVDIVTGGNELQINFGKLAEGPYEEIREGEVVTRFPASKRGEDENYGTRFYIYGSAKNIPDDYYENVTGGVTNHISEKRLHLPDGKEYIDVLNGEIVDTLPNGRIIERVIILEDVFPRNTSTISAIEEREEEVIEGRKDKTYSISSVDSEFEGTDEEVLSSLGITFTSGALSGSSFDVRWNKPFEQKFHIQPKVEGTGGSEQMVIPNEYLRPEVGDTFVLTGIKLPQEKVTEAEGELEEQGVLKAKEYGSDTNVYDCKTDPVYCQNNKKNYRLGRRVKLLGGAFGENGRTSRIQGFEKALWNEYDAIYNVGDNSAYSRVKAIAKGYANDSGRIVHEESTKWQNKMNVTIQSAAGNADITNKVNTLIGDVAENKAKIEAIEEDYIGKGEAVDFATDLTGVVEATSEEFVYRPSAGEKSIRDKSAVIRRIKGNSVVWEQKLKSPSDEGANWHGYTSSMLTTEIQGREMRCTLTGASVATNPYQVGITGILPSGSVGGHKYLFCAWVKVTYLNGQLGNNFSFEHDWNTWTLYPSVSELNKWTFVSRIWESPQNDNRISTIRPPWAYTGTNGAKAGDWYAIKDAMLFDLTTMFGTGNEPTTVEEFRAIYNDAYYPYCTPELRSVKTVVIKTVGFNLFDGEYARVIGGMSYIVSNYTMALYSETKGGSETEVHITNGIYTPECSGYLHLTPTKDPDTTPCVHFQHSGVMDGECAPYVAHTLELPEILKLFPNGMNAVGDVFDEINIDTYIQRCEYRDYAEGDESNTEVLTDGVHTVAKLTNPIITPLSEPITLDYYCEDWGSEEAISTSPSAPFRADIVYQFNAEGRIRDNSRNIDKLERIVAPLKNMTSDAHLATQDFVLACIPTRVAAATERRKVSAEEALLALLPNIMYDWSDSSLESITIPSLYINPETIGTHDYQWMVRFTTGTSDSVIIPFDVLWKDGIVPNWTAWCICEITFKCAAPQDEAFRKIIGEWKIFK